MESIRHPFIVRLYSAFQTTERLYFIMEFMNGGELFYHLHAGVNKGVFTETRTMFYAAQIVLALECLHSNGVIYRDLKPENIILCSNGYIKLTDFGLAKIKQREDDLTKSFCGTAEYLAPEIVSKTKKGYSKEVDFWSLGMIIYEMLCGESPIWEQN